MLQTGKRMPEDKRELLLNILSSTDLHDIAEGSEYTHSTIHALVYGSRSINKANHAMVDGLIKKAFEVLELKILFLKKLKPELEAFKTSYEMLHKTIELENEEAKIAS